MAAIFRGDGRKEKIPEGECKEKDVDKSINGFADLLRATRGPS